MTSKQTIFGPCLQRVMGAVADRELDAVEREGGQPPNPLYSLMMWSAHSTRETNTAGLPNFAPH